MQHQPDKGVRSNKLLSNARLQDVSVDASRLKDGHPTAHFAPTSSCLSPAPFCWAHLCPHPTGTKDVHSFSAEDIATMVANLPHQEGVTPSDLLDHLQGTKTGRFSLPTTKDNQDHQSDSCHLAGPQ